LAGRLGAAGAGPDTPVAVLLARSADLVVAQLAVLKTGGYYLPLDTTQPEARLHRLLRDAGVRHAVADEAPGWLPGDIRVVGVDDDGAADAPAPRAAPRPDAAVCLMYTSGSTGTPKGVVVTHRNVVELAADRRFATGAHARVLLHSAHTFDAVTYELWVPLLTGGTVVVAPPGRLDPGALRTAVRQGRVTALLLPPELLRVVLDLAPDTLADLREVWPAGDVVPAEVVRRVLAAYPGVVVVNGYGPTETTTFATGHEVRTPADLGPGSVPIGRPFDNTGAHVLDARLRPVPVGSVGELYLSGPGVTRGYLHQPARTAERFVAAPYAVAPGERMYRTGDLVRWTVDGVLEFIGRADNQVKIRGFRVEPDEVEVVLEECPGVRRAVVTVAPGPDGAKRLVAYLVAPGGDLGRVRRHAHAQLPGHLVPDVFQLIDRVPLGPHGKVDRSALPAPSASRRERRTGPAATPQEAALRGLFAEVLGTPDFAGDDSFFEAGGDSLLAMRLTAAIEAKLGLRMPISAVYEAPTPATLATGLDGRVTNRGMTPLLPLRPDGDGLPLFCVHPARGHGWSFAGLLPHLAPGRPVYALQAPFLGAGAPLPESIEELAEGYVDRIRAVRPRGPYALLGHSFGGLVAYEMAVRLRAAGQRIELLGVLDAVPVHLIGEPPELDYELVEQVSLGILLSAAPGAVPPTGRLHRDEVLAAVRAEGLFRGASDNRLTALLDVCSRHIRLAQRYRPPRYDGRLVLFSATAQPDGLSSATKVAAWREVAAGVTLHELDCAHGEVLASGPAAQVAAVVDAGLAASATEVREP
ncbi:amino acid adenylation domain-containing protein, partial [Actinoplanes sp. NPDC026623]|uniref:amino acid adenylation domain-containing protein n=1 Tax=Actinoplanes sp. NPDC026623 TaxID=3155610 RepID=UPI0033DA1707